MPLWKQPKTLRKLCLRNVASNMRMWSKDYKENYFDQSRGPFRFIEGPFNEIDAGSVQDLIKIMSKRNTISRLYLHLLIVPSLKEITLHGAAKHVTNEIVELICVRCNNVRSVNLSACDRVSAECMVKIITTFQATLVKLELANTKLNDKVLEAIGANCHKLRVLDIRMCKVTRKGLEKLLYEEKSERSTVLTKTGESIHTLLMLGCDFEGDVDFLMHVLQDCKTLRHVTHFSLWRSIVGLCEKNGEPPKLNLIGERHDMEIDFRDLESHMETLLLLPKCVPHIQHLALRSIGRVEMPVFKLLSECGKNLKSLEMDWCLPDDFLYFITVLCPNLEALTVDATDCQGYVACACHTTLAYQNFIKENQLIQSGFKPFQRLKQLSVNWTFPEYTAGLPSRLPVLKNIIGAASLTVLDLQRMPDEDVDEFLLQALRKGHFNNLETLCVSEAAHVTIGAISEIVLTSPKLKRLACAQCPKIMFHEYKIIMNYVAENNMAIEVLGDV